METSEIKAAVQTAVAQGLAAINSGKTPDLAKAYVGFWGEVGAGIGKNANNPHFKNDYADLAACTALVKPVMAKYKLALWQSPGEIKDGNVSLVSMLVHESGQAWTFRSELPIGAKATAQAAGSCITYARRYFVLAMAGLAPVDDDGQAASHPPEEADTDTDDRAADVERLTAAVDAIKVKVGANKLAIATALEKLKALKKECSASGSKALVENYLTKYSELKALNN